jgi:hypothetical protein
MGCNASEKKATDWAYKEIVWQHHTYQITNESVEDVEKEIGEITLSSDQETSYKGGDETFSNVLPTGTTLYKIKDVETETAIAFRRGEKDYRKATYHGEYGK